MLEASVIHKIMRALERAVQALPEPIVTAMHDASPWAILVTTLLSLRTRDVVTGVVASELLAESPRPEDMLALTQAELADRIRRVGFYNTKAATLQRVAKIILETHGGRVPDTLEELLALPGVGRKTANLVLIHGFGKPGICVDTHVHRISNRLGFVQTKTADQTEFALREVLPTQWWMKINSILVTWGQQVCLPRRPRCARCPVTELCPQSTSQQKANKAGRPRPNPTTLAEQDDS